MGNNNGICLDDATWRRVQKVARARGVTEDTVVQEAIEAYLQRQGGTLADAFEELGIVGCVKDAPPDLSTNEAYFEGFGRD
jgi:hypothetical protein